MSDEATKASEAARELAALVRSARLLCGCLMCQGPREIGAHTIAQPHNPRPTPSSCLAPTLLNSLLDALGKAALRKVTTP